MLFQPTFMKTNYVVKYFENSNIISEFRFLISGVAQLHGRRQRCNKPASQMAMTKFSLCSIFEADSRKFVNCQSIYIIISKSLSICIFDQLIDPNSYQANSFRSLGQVEFSRIICKVMERKKNETLFSI